MLLSLIKMKGFSHEKIVKATSPGKRLTWQTSGFSAEKVRFLGVPVCWDSAILTSPSRREHSPHAISLQFLFFSLASKVFAVTYVFVKCVYESSPTMLIKTVLISKAALSAPASGVTLYI